MHSRTVSLFVLLLQFLSSSIRAQTNFTVHPVSVIQAEGLEAVFECLHPGATSYGWAINGTFLSVYPSDLVAVSPSGGSPVSLTIPAIPEYNNTVVQCEAVVRVGGGAVFVLADNATLTVQGSLASVSVLQFEREMSCDSIFITWKAPFSLNLTTAEPDIQYCVDVYNVTEGEDHVVSSCDITETSYTFTPDNPSPDYLFNFTVTPRSNVQGSLNGTTSEPVRGYVIGIPVSIPADEVTFETNTDLDPIQFLFPEQALGSSPRRQPNNYTVTIEYIDDIDNQFNCSCPTIHNTNDDTVVLTLLCDSTCTVKRNRLYNVTITAHNNAGKQNSNPEMEISTHDVQNVKAVYSNRGQIDVSASYLSGSTARGFFIIVYSPMNHSDVTYRVAIRDGMEPTTNLSLGNLQHSLCTLAVYDLKENTPGIPDVMPAATPQRVNMDGQLNNGMDTEELVTSLPSLPDINITDNGTICISCSFSDPRTTGCVGVIHSAELVNLKLTILPVSRTDNNQPHNSNCTPGVLTGDYLVAVFGQLVDRLETAPARVAAITVESLPTSDPTTTTTPTVVHSDIIVAVTVGAGLAIVVVVMVVVVLAVAWICIVRARRTQRKTFNLTQDQPRESSVPVVDDRVDWSQTFAGIEQPNEAYSLVTKKNPSYEKPNKRKRRNQRTFNIQSQPPQLASIAESTQSRRDYVNTVAQGSEDCCQYERTFCLKMACQMLLILMCSMCLTSLYSTSFVYIIVRISKAL